MDVKKYLHLVALQVTHVLLPQGMVQEARQWLKERQHHPRAVFPLEPTLVYNLKQMIDHHEELNRSSNEQFARAQAISEDDEDEVQAVTSCTNNPTDKDSSPVQVPPPASWSVVSDLIKMKLNSHRKELAAGAAVIIAAMIIRAVYRRRKTTVYPAARRFWHELMELLDSAFSVNFGFSRIRRRQRRQQILGQADL